MTLALILLCTSRATVPGQMALALILLCISTATVPGQMALALILLCTSTATVPGQMVLALILLCTRYDVQNSYSTWTDGVSSDPPVYQVSCKTLGQTQDSCFCHTVHKPIQTLKYIV